MSTELLIGCTVLTLFVGAPLAALGQSDGPAPSLHAILERIRQREKQFDGYDAQVTWDIHNPGQPSPIFTHTGRFIRSGDKRHIDVEERYLFDPKQQRVDHRLFTFDGQTARHLHGNQASSRGKIYRDLESDLSRTGWYGPEMLGITVPDADGRRLSTMLEGDSVAVTDSTKLPKTVTILPRQEIDHEPVWPVEVSIMVPPSRGQVIVIYLSERHDYLPLRVEAITINGEQRLLMGRLSMSDVKELKPGLWYPTAGRLEIFQGKPEVQQTTTYHLAQITWPTTFADDLFTIQFPAGTRIFDEITGKDFYATKEPPQQPSR